MNRLLLSLLVAPALALAQSPGALPVRSPDGFWPKAGEGSASSSATNARPHRSVMRDRAMAAQTNAISLDPVHERQLEQQMTNVQAQLDAMAVEEQGIRQQVYAHHVVMTNFTAVVTTQDVQVARMTARVRELEAELGTLRTQLQVRVQSLPAYQDVDRQSRAIMARSTELRERRTQLMQERIRISGELWMIRKARQEQAGGSGTNGPAAPLPAKANHQ